MKKNTANTFPRLEMRKLSDLKAKPDGVSSCDMDSKFHLGASIDFFSGFTGLLRPLTVNAATDTVIDGDTVLGILRERGLEFAPCYIVNIPVEFEDAAHLALNNRAAEWEWEHVATRLKELLAQGRKAELSGFPSSKITALCAVEDWHPKEPTQLDGAPSQQDGFSFL